MKKFVTALVALTAALFLMTGSFAEESHEVNAQITFTTDETVDSIAAPEIPIGSLSAEVFGFDAGQTYAVYSAPDVKVIGCLFSMMLKTSTIGSDIFPPKQSPLE